MCIEVIVCNVTVVFLRHSVYCVDQGISIYLSDVHNNMNRDCTLLQSQTFVDDVALWSHKWKIWKIGKQKNAHEIK